MTVLMHEMTWPEFETRIKKEYVILPTSSTEQHGPTLPLGVDTMISTGLAEMLAKETNGIVAPNIHYGYKSAPFSGGGPLFPGTIDISGNTLINLVYDILEELIRDGVKKILVLNGHFENEAFLLEAIDLVTKKYSDVMIIEASWWDQVSLEVRNKVFNEVPFPGWALEHAAIAETSLTMFFRPDLVQMDKFVEEPPVTEPGYSLYPATLSKIPKSGLLATARSSSSEKGKLMAEDIVNNYSKIVRANFK